MSIETFNPGQSVTATAAAQEHFRQQLQGKPADGIRLSVKESGCTGFMYTVDLVAGAESEDLVIELDNGIKLFVDRAALPVVNGTEIDLVKEGLNRNLTFKNPNVSEQCGCGESFNVTPAAENNG